MAGTPKRNRTSLRAAVFAAAAVCDAALAVTGRDRVRWATKPLLMPLLMSGKDRRTRAALALGWLGDVALLGEGEVAFQAGLASFLAGHLAWIGALRQRPGGGRLRARPVLAVVPVAGAVAMNVALWPRTGKNRAPVLAYSGALLAMSLTAIDRGSPAAAAGGMLFLASDALLALGKFGVADLPGAEGLVMLSYAAGQALLAGRPSGAVAANGEGLSA